VFSTLQNWRAEYRIYRRSEKGEVIKENDHLMDDTRYLVMSGIAIAAQRPFEQWAGRPGFEHLRPPRQLESDYDPYAEARRVGGSETQSRWVTHHIMPGSQDWHSRR